MLIEEKTIVVLVANGPIVAFNVLCAVRVKESPGVNIGVSEWDGVCGGVLEVTACLLVKGAMLKDLFDEVRFCQRCDELEDVLTSG